MAPWAADWPPVPCPSSRTGPVLRPPSGSRDERGVPPHLSNLSSRAPLVPLPAPRTPEVLSLTTSLPPCLPRLPLSRPSPGPRLPRPSPLPSPRRLRRGKGRRRPLLVPAPQNLLLCVLSSGSSSLSPLLLVPAPEAFLKLLPTALKCTHSHAQPWRGSPLCRVDVWVPSPAFMVPDPSLV